LVSMDGVFVVDKDAGWTSHDVVAKMRRIADTRKIGHLGTLDPMATGVLPLVIGRATRLAQFYTRSSKIYDAVVRFGFATDTYDRDGKPTSPETSPEIDRGEIETHLSRFRGTFLQAPPPVSAKKIFGTPAYRLARKQVAFVLEPVEVTIDSVEIVEVAGPQVRLIVHCSGGTYMRSLAHDLGIAAGCGAHLSSLRRLASGDFRLEQARTIRDLESLAGERMLQEALVPAAQLLPEFPAESVDSITENQIRQGRDFRVSPFRAREGSRFVKAIARNGDLVAIGEAKLPHIYHPILVF
jgi:tRNA pseudouridine55 synthase